MFTILPRRICVTLENVVRMLSLVYCPREIVTGHCLQVALCGGDEDGRLLGISSHHPFSSMCIFQPNTIHVECKGFMEAHVASKTNG